MKMLRLVGCPLALAAAMLFTVGCGGEEDASSDTTENSTPSTASTDPVSKTDTSEDADGEMVMVSLELPGMT